MTKARDIITDALTWHLNRLAPGEALDADSAASCLLALNGVIDGVNGARVWLFREAFASAVVTGAGTLGVTWPGIPAGTPILGAVRVSGDSDVPLAPLTMQQYEALSIKSTPGEPDSYAHDGLSSVLFYPVPTAVTIKLRTRVAVDSFADLDTEYTLPPGFPSALAVLLADAVADVFVGRAPETLPRKVRAARLRLLSQSVRPAIVGSQLPNASDGQSLFQGVA